MAWQGYLEARSKKRSHSLKMDPRPFLWLRITRPMASVYFPRSVRNNCRGENVISIVSMEKEVVVVVRTWS